jgi:alpha-tubulin suppressor-like RCC1 family protein
MQTTITFFLAVLLLTSLPFPPSLNAQVISAGQSHSLAICKNGSLMGWGRNLEGQIGDSSKTQRSYPSKVKILKDVIAVAAGTDNSMALKKDGTVWVWGSGLGTGAIAPKQVSGLNNVISISLKDGHALVLKNDSTVWAWGSNGQGELGDGTTTDRNAPVKVAGLTGIVAIAAGYNHSIALKKDGSVWGWGFNFYGSLGDSSSQNHSLPVQVKGLTNVKSIAAAADYSLAIRNDGTVWAWGNNGYGQLGDSTNKNRYAPVKVKKLSDITAIACGTGHAFALKNDGTAWAWGNTSNGQIGNGSPVLTLVPTKINALANIKAISCGNIHSLAVKNNYVAVGFGHNETGELGVGDKNDRYTPVVLNSLCEVLDEKDYFPLIKVSGKNIEIGNGDISPDIADNTDFGLVKVSGSKKNVFKLYNLGNDTLVISTIRVSGSDSANFKLQNLVFPLKVKKGDSLSFDIIINPLSNGIKTTKLIIINNDTTNSLYSFAVKGMAIIPAIGVSGLNTQILHGDISPSNTDNTSFGNVKRDLTKKNKFKIRNTGTDTLRISKIITTGIDSILFTVGNINLAKTILPSDSAEFEVSFHPLGNGAKFGTVNIYSNDQSTPVYNYSIDGTCISPVIRIRGNNRDINNNDLVPDITDHTDFGTTDKFTDVKWNFTIYNAGSDTLLTRYIQVNGLNNTRFMPDISSLKPALLPGNSTYFGLTLKADSPGLKKAVIKISSNDTDHNPYSFSVQGNIIQGSGLHTAIKDGMSLYPNPADKLLILEFGTELSNASILIYTSTGQIVYESDEISSSRIQINTSQLPPGIYFVQMSMHGRPEGKVLLISR